MCVVHVYADIYMHVHACIWWGMCIAPRQVGISRLKAAEEVDMLIEGTSEPTCHDILMALRLPTLVGSARTPVTSVDGAKVINQSINQSIKQSLNVSQSSVDQTSNSYIPPWGVVVLHIGVGHSLVLCLARARLPARNHLVNEVEFLGLITQNG